MPCESKQDRRWPGPDQQPASMSLTEAAASVAARAFFYPSLAWNMARNKLQVDWHWWDSVTEGVILGAIPFLSQLQELKSMGVTAVVTLNEDFEVFITSDQYKEQGFTHLHIPTVDFLYAPPTENLHQGADFIHDNAIVGGKTYVHCKAGRGRSTTLVLCYLIKYFGYDPEQAYAFVRGKRPQVYLAQGQWTAVCAFYISCHPGEDLDSADFPYPKFLPLAPGKQGSDGPEPSAATASSFELDSLASSPLEVSSAISNDDCSRSVVADSQCRPVENSAEPSSCRSEAGLSQGEVEENGRSDQQNGRHPDDASTNDAKGHAAAMDKIGNGAPRDPSCTEAALDSLAAALGACAVQSMPESGGIHHPGEIRAFSPPARASSPAIPIPEPKIRPAPTETPKCSISIEPSGSLPGYVRIAPQGKRTRQSVNSPVSVCSMSLISALKEEDTEQGNVKSGFARVCQEEDDWDSVDSD